MLIRHAIASAAAHGWLLGPAQPKSRPEAASSSQTATIGPRRAARACGLRGRQRCGHASQLTRRDTRRLRPPSDKKKTLCARTQRRAPALSTPRERMRRTDAAIRRTKAKARVCHAGRIPREAWLPLKLPFRISERLAHFEIVPPRRTTCVVLRRRPARSQPALPRPICDSVWYYGSLILRF